MGKVPVSVIIVTHNEEANIADCIRSVLWADQVIVIDGASTDKTREIALDFRVEVLNSENSPAETQRLKALKHVRHQWFFLLDADERVSDELKSALEDKVMNAKEPRAYYVLRKNIYRSRAVHLHDPDYQLRLFHISLKSALPTKIHRIPEITVPTEKINAPLVHHFFTNWDDYFRKLEFYTQIEANYWREENKIPTLTTAPYYFLFRPLARFIQYFVVKRGFLDGLFGLRYCLSSAYYDWKVAGKAMSAKTT